MKRAAVILTVLLITTFSFGCSKPSANSSASSSIPVNVITITKADLQMNYTASGQIEAAAEAAIAPKITGRVAAVNVKLGDRVKKGQVLFQLEAKEGLNQLTQTQASLGITQANYQSAAQALNDAQIAYNRSKSLYDSGAISKNDLETANSKLVNARLTLQQVKQQVEQSRASLSNAQTNYNDYSVTSPIDGMVGEINVEAGEMVSQQSQSAVVVNLDTVKVSSSVPESVVNTIKPGISVPVSIKTLNKTVNGVVTAVSPKANSTTMGYPVEVTIANSSEEIKPGMTASLNLSTGLLQDVIVVPVNAVIEQDGQSIVYVIEKNQAKEVTINVGVSNDTQIEIIKGLNVGQKVVTEGNRLLSDGQLVKVTSNQAGDAK